MSHECGGECPPGQEGSGPAPSTRQWSSPPRTPACAGANWPAYPATTSTLQQGIIRVHPDLGALHEVGGKLFLGPPKTPDSVREIHLPEFLVELLQQIAGSHPQIVFCGAHGGYQRHPNFNRRAWTPAASGHPDKGITPVVAGMHFHDLRHSHKTWLIEDGVPEIAQARRLGHRRPGVRGIYSHVTPAMQHRITAARQHRWTTTGGHPEHHTGRRRYRHRRLTTAARSTESRQ